MSTLLSRRACQSLWRSSAQRRLLQEDSFAQMKLSSHSQSTTSGATKPHTTNISSKLLATVSLLGKIFTRQANVYVYNRLRKANRIYHLYHTVYGQAFFTAFLNNLRTRLYVNPKRGALLLCAAIFDFKKEGISDAEVSKCVEEFEILKGKRAQSPRGTCKVKCDCPPNKLKIEEFRRHLTDEGYEPVVESDRLHIWRKQDEDDSNYRYKVYGTFLDIPARAFFAVQCDTDYRKKWDKLVMTLDIVDKNDKNDVIYWHMHYPFPMSSRDYVFIRRTMIDAENDVMVLVSHSCDHPELPLKKGVVRVSKYMSNMVISPHSSFDENGFDYLLTYYDDPQSSFPSPVYAWMAASGVHDYLEKLHKATKIFHEGSRASCAAECRSSQRSSNRTTPVQYEAQYA